MASRRSAVFVLIGAGLLAACASVPKDPPGAELSGSPAFAVVLDDGRARKAALVAARVAVGLADEGAALGVFAAGGPTAVAPLARAPARSERAKLVAGLEQGPRFPIDLAGALRKARLSIEGQKAGPGRVVIATDDDLWEGRVRVEVAALMAAGHQVERVALGGALEDVAARTGAALGWTPSEPRKLGKVSPGGGRVAFVALGGALGGVTRGGSSSDAAIAALGGVEVAVVDGSSEADVPSRGPGLVLLQGGADLDFAREAPPSIAKPDVATPVVLRARSSRKLAVTASVEQDGRSAGLALREAGGGEWRGQAPALRAGDSARVLVRAVLEAGDVSFAFERERPWVALPPPPPPKPVDEPAKPTPEPVAEEPLAFTAPEAVDLGDVWADVTAKATLEVKGDPKRAVKVALEAAPGLVLAPQEVPAGGTARLDLEVDPKKAGERAVLAGKAGASTRSTPLAVRFRAHSLEGPARLDLGKLEPGKETTRPLGLTVAPPVASGLEVTVAVADARGVTATIKGDEVVLAATRDAPPGARTGTVELRLGTAAPRLVPFALSITAPAAPKLAVSPEKLVLEGRSGWVEAKVEVAALSGGGALAIEAGELKGGAARITPRRDIRVVPQGWDGKTLETDQKGVLLVRVYVPSDLPRGRYAGEIKVRLGERSEKTVAVEVEVKK